MKVLVVYDSNFGNTKIIADEIAKELQGESVSVKDLKNSSLKEVGLLVVGSPINAWRPSAKTRMFLNSLAPGSLSGIKATAFDTRLDMFISGNAAKTISKRLKEAGATLVLEPKGFYVKDKEGPLNKGEVEKARLWAGQIYQRCVTNAYRNGQH